MTANQAHTSAYALDSADVADYLRAHPRFFHQHLELLESLEVPHVCGQAVSLVAKQIDVLRDKSRKLEMQLNEIVRIARENDAVFRRIHELTLSLLDAASVEDALASLRWILHEAFEAEFVTLRVFSPYAATAVADLFASADASVLDPVRAMLDAGVPVCGEPSLDTAVCLFDRAGAEVVSYAFIPLRHAGLKGFLAIGSRCAERFQPSMGNFFLAQMGEIVASRLVDLFQRVSTENGG